MELLVSSAHFTSAAALLYTALCFLDEMKRLGVDQHLVGQSNQPQVVFYSVSTSLPLCQDVFSRGTEGKDVLIVQQGSLGYYARGPGISSPNIQVWLLCDLRLAFHVPSLSFLFRMLFSASLRFFGWLRLSSGQRAGRASSAGSEALVTGG